VRKPKSKRRVPRGLLRFLAQYWDLLMTAGLALVVGIIGVAGGLEGAPLSAATLGVLAVLAATLVRDRWKADRLVDAVQDVLAVASGAKPWEVLSAEFEWEIETTDGKAATATTRRQLRFLQDEVLAIHEFFTPDGRVAAHSCKGGPPKGYQKDLPIIDDRFPGPRGRTFQLISLEGVYRRGQKFNVESVRQLADCFIEDHESVMIEITVATGECSMSVIWPDGGKPRAVQLQRNDDGPSTVDLGDIKTLPDGRTQWTRWIEAPRVGDSFAVSWDR
jgi:hypothetical protein